MVEPVYFIKDSIESGKTTRDNWSVGFMRLHLFGNKKEKEFLMGISLVMVDETTKERHVCMITDIARAEDISIFTNIQEVEKLVLANLDNIYRSDSFIQEDIDRRWKAFCSDGLVDEDRDRQWEAFRKIAVSTRPEE